MQLFSKVKGELKNSPEKFSGEPLAPSKNAFSVLWAEDFGSEKVMKAPEYFVYCGAFMTHFRSERFAHSTEKEFLEVAYIMTTGTEHRRKIERLGLVV